MDPETEKFIRTVALKVKENGDSFEDLLRERERANPKFAFLFNSAVSRSSSISISLRLYAFVDTRASVVQSDH